VVTARTILSILTLITFLPFPLRADPVREVLDSVTSERYPDAPSVIVFDSTKTEVEPTGLSHVTRHVLIKILEEEGATDHSSMRFDYDPASNMIEIRDLRILKKDGSVEEVAGSAVRDLPQPQYMIYWGARMKLAGLTGLEPGDAVEYRTYTKGFMIAYLYEEADESRYIPPMKGHFYDVVLFEENRPIIEKVYTLILPRDKPVQSKVYNGEVSSSTYFDSDKLVYTWWKQDVPASEREPRMVAGTDALTKVVLATVPDWYEKSRWFWEVNEPQFGWNDDIKAKVDELTRGLKTDDEKRAALLRWVARHIRYSGITMGEGEGYTLHSGIMTFNDRAGVCKDIASMLVTMLRTAGYTTYPAMTMAGARVERIPADQFNHCVVAVKLDDGSYKLYDPTWCPFSREIWSSAEQNQNFVIGSPEGEDLMITPPVSPEDNFIRMRAKNRIDRSGDLAGTVTITAAGYTETNLRWGIVYEQKQRMRHNLERWLYSASPLAEVTRVTMTDPVDLDTPLMIELGYRIPKYASLSDAELVFTPVLAKYIVENGRLNDYRSAVESDDRKYDISLRCTRYFDFEEEVELPSGYQLIGTPDPGSEDGEAASFKVKLTQKGKMLVLDEELRIKKKIIPVEDYPNLKRAVDLMKDLSDLNLVFAKKGS